MDKTQYTEIKPEVVYLTIPTKWVCVYHKLLSYLADFGKMMIDDCNAGCRGSGKNIITCWNLFQSAVASHAIGEDKQAEFFNDIKNIISDILDNMEFIKIKPEISDDLKYMLNALKQEVEAKNIKTTNALIIGTIYTLKQVRKLRRYESNFRDALEELYL